MRILLLNYEFPPLGGGASAASFELARALVRSGHHVDVVTSRMQTRAAYEQVDGISIWRVYSRRIGIQDCGLLGAATYVASATVRTAQLLRAEAYDVVHYFFGMPTGALCLTLPPLRRVPSVLSLRGSDVPGYDRSNEMLPRLHSALRGVTRRIWSSMDRLIANSDGLRKLAQSFEPSRQINMIPNAVCTDTFRPDAGRQRNPSDPLRVLCVARLILRKGVHDLLEAVARVPGPPVQLILQGSGRDEPQLRRRIAELGLGDRVHLAGFKQQSELPGVYADADVFVLPSHSESCSMALLEAMASGLPIIATDVGGTPELIRDHSGGFLIPPRDSAALAHSLSTLRDHPECRKRMGDFNRARSLDFTWSKVGQRYLEEYAAAIAHHGARPGPADRKAGPRA